MKPGLTVEFIGQQSSVAPGVHPLIDFNYHRRVMPNDQWVQENRFAIITIMLKQIASELREKWPHLHIKAHPMAYGASRARLVIRQKDTRVIVDVRQGPLPNWRMQHRKDDPNEYNVFVKITEGNDVSKKKTPQPWSFSLDDPESTVKFESWVESVVGQWIDVGSHDNQQEQRPADPNGSTEA